MVRLKPLAHGFHMLAGAEPVCLEIHAGAVIPFAVNAPVHDLVTVFGLGIPDIKYAIGGLIRIRRYRQRLPLHKLSPQFLLPFFRSH